MGGLGFRHCWTQTFQDKSAMVRVRGPNLFKSSGRNQRQHQQWQLQEVVHVLNDEWFNRWARNTCTNWFRVSDDWEDDLDLL
jgi:hypothetical protein